MSQTCDPKDFIIKEITSLHSSSTARVIINDNFKTIAEKILCLADLTLDDVNDLILPDPPQAGVQYVLEYDGSNFVFVEANTNPGTKYIIDDGENIVVKNGYQYIVNDYLILNGSGTITLEGNAELVVL